MVGCSCCTAGKCTAACWPGDGKWGPGMACRPRVGGEPSASLITSRCACAACDTLANEPLYADLSPELCEGLCAVLCAQTHSATAGLVVTNLARPDLAGAALTLEPTESREAASGPAGAGGAGAALTLEPTESREAASGPAGAGGTGAAWVLARADTSRLGSGPAGAGGTGATLAFKSAGSAGAASSPVGACTAGAVPPCTAGASTKIDKGLPGRCLSALVGSAHPRLPLLMLPPRVSPPTPPPLLPPPLPLLLSLLPLGGAALAITADSACPIWTAAAGATDTSGKLGAESVTSNSSL